MQTWRRDCGRICRILSLLIKQIFNALFTYVIKKTEDFEEVFGTNTVDKLPFTEAMLPSLKSLISYLSQIKWSDINVDVIGRIFEGSSESEKKRAMTFKNA